MDFSAVPCHLIFCLCQQAVKLWQDPESSFAKGTQALILCQHGIKPTQQIHAAPQVSNSSGSTALWSMLYYRTSVHMSRNRTYVTGSNISLDEAIFEFSIAREHFLIDLLMAVSMEWTSMAQEKPSFPLPSSPVRCDGTVQFSLPAGTGTVSGTNVWDQLLR